mmetsp:Transcript_63040/g.172957  ORF Transcript_63040/g.172957 Transcript_63040/m.172957 type:complete len:417 (+) Transcript_63040:255-1505(+)
MVAWDLLGGGRCARVDDILAVYREVEQITARAGIDDGGSCRGGCLTLPSFAFQEFCFFKTRYMKHLVAHGVPIGPTLFVERAEYLSTWGGKASGECYGEGGGGDGDDERDVERDDEAGGGCDSGGRGSLGALLLARKLAKRVVELSDEVDPWGSVVNDADVNMVGHPPRALRMRINAFQLFVKGNSGWCREGNVTIGSEWIETGGEVGAAAFRAGIEDELKLALEKMFVVDGTSGLQVQPCLCALAGQSQEFRGLHVNGKLVWVASTYFRKAGGASYNLAEIDSEVMVIDYGVPNDDRLLSGVPFRRVREVMEASCRAITDLLGEVPICIRTDVAVDPETGAVVLSEIEGGLDFSVFPSQVTSYPSTTGIIDELADRFEQEVTKERVAVLQGRGAAGGGWATGASAPPFVVGLGRS